MQQRKITFFSPSLAGGGAERVISVLATRSAEEGYDVDLVLVKAAGPYLSNIPSSVKIVDLRSKRTFSCLLKLIRYLRESRPRILFTSQIHSSTIAILAVRLARMRILTNVVVRQPTMLMPSCKKVSFEARARIKLFMLCVKSAAKIVVTSEAMAEEFRSLTKVSNSKINIIYNPLPITEIQAKSDETIKHEWFEDGALPVILAVGRLEAVKGFKTLISSFAIVQKVTPARLVILGEGEMREELENFADALGVRDFISMPGFVSNPYQYMKRAKLFVLSSLWEGFPNGMIEAMACGSTIVATNCEGGTAEILEYGKWGQLVPVSDAEKIAAAIMKGLESPTAPCTQKRANDFSIDSVFKEYAELFDSLLYNSFFSEDNKPDAIRTDEI